MAWFRSPWLLIYSFFVNVYMWNKWVWIHKAINGICVCVCVAWQVVIHSVLLHLSAPHVKAASHRHRQTHHSCAFLCNSFASQQKVSFIQFITMFSILIKSSTWWMARRDVISHSKIEKWISVYMYTCTLCHTHEFVLILIMPDNSTSQIFTCLCVFVSTNMDMWYKSCTVFPRLSATFGTGENVGG